MVFTGNGAVHNGIRGGWEVEAMGEEYGKGRRVSIHVTEAAILYMAVCQPYYSTFNTQHRIFIASRITPKSIGVRSGHSG
jgi:hypothetical protein